MRAHAVLVLAVGQQTHLGLIKFACSALLAKLLSMITTKHWCCFSVIVIKSGNTVGYATTNSFYQQNLDATSNTDAKTNAEEYYRPT
jgi:hypothetical protein